MLLPRQTGPRALPRGRAGCVLQGVLAGAFVVAHADIAGADASAWVFAGGGAVAHKQADADMAVDPALMLDVGVGTTPDARFVFGGLFRLVPIFGSGTDLALLARGATRGFQAGDFGLALDAGGYARFWGTESGGFLGGVTLGAPLGLTMALTAHAGTDSSVGFGVVAGLDFARLTVFRQTLLQWWPNPLPAQREPYGDASRAAVPTARW